jgi:hypothetical protein
MGYAATAQVKRAQRRLAVLLRTLHAHLRLTPTHQLARRAQARAARGVIDGEGGGGGGGQVAARPSLNAGLLNALRADMAALVEGQAFEVCAYVTQIDQTPGASKCTCPDQHEYNQQSYRFADVPTPYGVLRIAVAYRADVSDLQVCVYLRIRSHHLLS